MSYRRRALVSLGQFAADQDGEDLSVDVLDVIDKVVREASQDEADPDAMDVDSNPMRRSGHDNRCVHVL